jgi:hypothetical protein
LPARTVPAAGAGERLASFAFWSGPGGRDRGVDGGYLAWALDRRLVAAQRPGLAGRPVARLGSFAPLAVTAIHGVNYWRWSSCSTHR